MYRLSEEDKQTLGVGVVTEVGYYFCDFCKKRHPETRPELYEHHLRFRNEVIGIKTITVIKGGK